MGLNGSPPSPTPLTGLLLVAAGAVPGALLRWLLADLRLANLAGSLLLGLIVALGRQSPRLLLGGGVGFCGALTSYSTWIFALDRALVSGSAAAVAGQLAQLPAGLAAAALGLALGRRIARRRGGLPLRR